MKTPIFILGWGRSGTTWISNLLIKHPKITGIHHEKHWGIHESAYFSLIEGRYGDLDNPANFVEFAQVMAASDYFRLAGADVKFLYSLYPSSYAKVFQSVMERFASQQNATHWVEKTPLHTLYAESIAKYYPDVLFIAITRNVAGVITSRFKYLHSDYCPKGKLHSIIMRLIAIPALVLVWQHYNNTINSLKKKYPSQTITITYEDLVADTDSVMHSVCDFMGIAFNEGMLTSSYVPNSSFLKNSPTSKRRTLLSWEKRWISISEKFAVLVPHIVLNICYKVSSYLYNIKHKALPVWFFRLLKDAPEELHRKLLNSE